MLKIDRYDSRLTTPATYNIHKISLRDLIHSKRMQNYSKNTNLNINLIDEISLIENKIDAQFLKN